MHGKTGCSKDTVTLVSFKGAVSPRFSLLENPMNVFVLVGSKLEMH